MKYLFYYKFLQEKNNKLQQIRTDNQIPLIDILSAISSGKQGIVKGRATDNVEVAEVTIDGKTIPIDNNGYFEHKKTKVPPWVKNNASWWAEGLIDDDAFAQGIEFLIKEGIIDAGKYS